MKQVLFFSMILLSIGSFAQKAGSKVQFAKGQKLEMTIDIHSNMAGGMGKIDGMIVRSFDVEDASQNKTVIEHKIKRIMINMESMMGNNNFDSDKPSDLNSDNGKPIAKALKNKYTMTLDQNARVTDVKKDNNNPNDSTKSTDSGNMIANVLEQISSGLEIPMVGDRTDFAILPTHDVSKGESWSDSAKGRQTTYTLKDITDNELLVDYTETGSNQSTQEMMGMQMTINTKDQTTGSIVIDKKTGLMKSKKASTNTDGTVEAMGNSIPITQTTTRTWTIK